jgi:hypothetical protein
MRCWPGIAQISIIPVYSSKSSGQDLNKVIRTFDHDEQDIVILLQRHLP